MADNKDFYFVSGASQLKDISLFDDNDDALVTLAEYKDKWLSVNPRLNESLITSRFNARDKDGKKSA